MAFYNPENMAAAYFLHQNGDMDGTDQKEFSCLCGTVPHEYSRLCPSIPSSSPSSALGFHLPAPLLWAHSSPGEPAHASGWFLWHGSDSGELHWWFWLLCRAWPIPGFCLSGGGSVRHLAIGNKTQNNSLFTFPKQWHENPSMVMCQSSDFSPLGFPNGPQVVTLPEYHSVTQPDELGGASAMAGSEPKTAELLAS